MYTLGCKLYFIDMGPAIAGGPMLVPVALTCLASATATSFVCLHAYILD